MSTPQAHAEGYAASDVLGRHDNLPGRALLTHGMPGVHRSLGKTPRVLNALQEKSIPFEAMLYPGQRHGIRGNARQLHQWRTYLDFLDRTIGTRAPQKAD